MVADSADSYNTKMSPNAIAISVAPSLFHSCIHEGAKVLPLSLLFILFKLQAKLEDVQRFKLASQVVQFIITSFGHTALFPRECYEFYARITGRTLRIDENYQFTFQYPSSEFFISGQEIHSPSLLVASAVTISSPSLVSFTHLSLFGARSTILIWVPNRILPPVVVPQSSHQKNRATASRCMFFVCICVPVCGTVGYFSWMFQTDTLLHSFYFLTRATSSLSVHVSTVFFIYLLLLRDFHSKDGCDGFFIMSKNSFLLDLKDIIKDYFNTILHKTNTSLFSLSQSSRVSLTWMLV